MLLYNRKNEKNKSYPEKISKIILTNMYNSKFYKSAANRVLFRKKLSKFPCFAVIL